MVRRSQVYRQKERILLLLSRRLQENLEQNYDARYNDLVRDKLCSHATTWSKVLEEGRIRNQMIGLGSKGSVFARRESIIQVFDGEVEDVRG